MRVHGLIAVIFSLLLVQKLPAQVIGWGMNSYGQATDPYNLVSVAALAGGSYHNVALTTSGTVYAWGQNNWGEATVPSGLTGVKAVAAGAHFSMAVKSDGTVVVWGLGSGSTLVPPAGLSTVVAVAAGNSHALALKMDGTVVGWGYNAHGEATPPTGLTDVIAIAAGNFHSLALKKDGTVVCWGYNFYGQCTPPAGLTGVRAIAGSAGGNFSLAVKGDGTVIGWGYNTYGETTPPAGLTGVKAVAAGDHHSVALKMDGTVVCWGQNTYGQTSYPGGASNGHQLITAGWFHSLAFKPVCGGVTALSWFYTDQGFISGGQNGALRQYSDLPDIINPPWHPSADGLTLRLDFENDYSCAGYNPYTQTATADTTVAVPCGRWRMYIAWVGMGEQKQANYELMTLSVDGDPVGSAHAPGGGPGCNGTSAFMGPVVSSPAPPQFIDIVAGTQHQIHIDATTNDASYHTGAYYQFSLTFEYLGP